VGDGGGEIVSVETDVGEIIGPMVFVMVLVGTGVWVCDGTGVEVGMGVFDGWMRVLVATGSGVGVRVVMKPSSSPTMKRVMDARQQVLARRQITRIKMIIGSLLSWLILYIVTFLFHSF
jgi:hypothetical protein